MTMQVKTAATIAAVGLAVSGASAGYNIAQSSDAPTAYATTLNFDEVGGPTGVVDPASWAGIGLADMQAGDGVPQVGDFQTLFAAPWIGSGNSFYGNFGVFMTFSVDLTALSVQVWDPSGPPSFLGGGLNVILFNDGAQVWDVNAQNGGGPFDPIATPAWGGVGDATFDITTTDGMVFDEVRILGYGFGPTTFVDNISWQAVPAPGAVALFGAAGLASVRRRR